MAPYAFMHLLPIEQSRSKEQANDDELIKKKTKNKNKIGFIESMLLPKL